MQLPSAPLDDFARYREVKEREIVMLRAELGELRAAIRRRDTRAAELVRAFEAFVAWWGTDGWSVSFLNLQRAVARVQSELET